MRKIDWTTSLFLILTPLATLVFAPWYIKVEGWHWSLFFLLALFWALTEVSITAGYHRFMAHRSYDAKWWIKLFYLVVGAAAFQGSALKWGSDHRRHHRFVDTEKDPYNIKNGFWYAHIGWLLLDTEPEYKDKFAPDLENDRLIYLQHKFYGPIAILTGFGLPILAGALVGRPWGGLIFAGFFRIVLAHHCTFFINSLCHTLGRQPYSDSHSARDSFIMAILTFGEGYHNFHHTFANDYRNGIRWYHWDPTKWAIRLSAAFGLAKNLRTTPDNAILVKRLQMDEIHVKEKWSHRWEVALEERITHLKQNVSIAQAKWLHLKEEYQALKKSYSDASHTRLEELRAEMHRARREFKWHWDEWKAYHSQLLIAAPARI